MDARGYQELEVEGGRFRVLVGNDAAEVEKWRAERRRRWPSRANLESRAREKQKEEPSGLAGLAAYGSDSDASEPAPAPERPRPRRPCLAMLHSGSCARGDGCQYDHDVSDVPPCAYFARHGSCRRGRNCRNAHHDGGARETGPPAYVPPGGTLLRKLLHSDIRREAGLILQCITGLLDADEAEG
mmetsp:Transcript_15398/g.45993  ORF Transcript_15398/g.45993 Transcript_15398/m.45993 type:complete len:185 (+) Transcript_15398:250-804(+)